jgi:hypothetical protein
VLVVVLQACLFMLGAEMSEMMPVVDESGEITNVTIADGWAVVIAVGIVTFYVVSMILRLGLLRSIFTDGAKPCEPGELLRTGKPFFWRMFRFEIIYGAVLAGVMIILIMVISSVFLDERQIANPPRWVMPMSLFAGCVLLAKPWMLMPAVFIAGDTSLVEAFRLHKRFSLMGQTTLIGLFVLLSAARVGLINMDFINDDSSAILKYSYLGACTILISAVIFAVNLVALKFVAGDFVESVEVEAEIEAGDAVE